MNCPKCAGGTKVLESRFNVSLVIRKRTCLSCGHDFYTVERFIDTFKGERLLNRVRSEQKKRIKEYVKKKEYVANEKSD